MTDTKTPECPIQIIHVSVYARLMGGVWVEFAQGHWELTFKPTREQARSLLKSFIEELANKDLLPPLDTGLRLCLVATAFFGSHGQMYVNGHGMEVERILKINDL